LLAFDKGEIDFTYLTADEVERESQNTNAIVIPGPSQVANAITMNPSKNPAFGNPKFRQAVLYAINRQSISDNLYKGTATPVSCLYGNPELDKLLDQGVAEMDPAKRPEIYQQACKMMSEDLPWLFLWETIRYGIVSKRIGNFLFTPAPGGGSYYDQAEKWFIRK